MSALSLRTVDLARLNSLTKYPSIPTYHPLGDKGRLLPDRPVGFAFEPGDCFVTEKVDGTNARIVVVPECWPGPRFVVGSREQLIHADGDLIANPVEGIADAVRGFARTATGPGDGSHVTPRENELVVLYGEVYGGKVGGQARNYSKTGLVGFRLFDVGVVEGLADKLTWEREAIAAWRDAGGQRWWTPKELDVAARSFGVATVPLVATLPPPATLAEVLAWLGTCAAESQAALDGDPSRPEGVVVRNADRTLIAKIRYEDYERTLGGRGRR